MEPGPKIAYIAALIGDPARASMLSALMGGKALTASALAEVAGVSAPTASGHLNRLMDGGLIEGFKQGRHRFYNLAGPLVGQLLETAMAVAQEGPAQYRPRWGGPSRLRLARTCYDHLAGRVGVAIASSLSRRGLVDMASEFGRITESGVAAFAEIGIDMDVLKAQRRPECRPCLDWSERRLHLAGGIGKALLVRLHELAWFRAIPGTRALDVTEDGFRGLSEMFEISRGELLTDL